MRETISQLTTAAAEAPADIDRLRNILIACGQWEHAVENGAASPCFSEPKHATDSLTTMDRPDQDTLTALRDLTDCAADAFCLAWRLESTRTPLPRANLSTYEMRDPVTERIAPWIDAVFAQLAAVPETGRSLRVEVLEGFTNGLLYPEQYAAAAERWCRENKGLAVASRAAVVGVQGIGASLSAVVAGMLRLNGWRASRFVVQPSENRSEPEVVLPVREMSALALTTQMLIVDGDVEHGWASMRATASAIESAGIDRRRVSYFPALSGDEEPSTYHAPLPTVRAAGYSLVERLVDRTMKHFAVGCSMREIAVEELTSDERPAYRIAMPDGRALTWRFAGVAVDEAGKPLAQAVFETLQARAAEGRAVAPVDAALGFVAVPCTHEQAECHSLKAA